MVLGRYGRCLDSFDTPASSVGRSDGMAAGSCLRKVNLRPSCERFQIILISREETATIENCLTLGVQSVGLGTTCVQEGGFEGPEIGPKQRRINNRRLGYRLNPARSRF